MKNSRHEITECVSIADYGMNTAQPFTHSLAHRIDGRNENVAFDIFFCFSFISSFYYLCSPLARERTRLTADWVHPNTQKNLMELNLLVSIWRCECVWAVYGFGCVRVFRANVRRSSAGIPAEYLFNQQQIYLCFINLFLVVVIAIEWTQMIDPNSHGNTEKRRRSKSIVWAYDLIAHWSVFDLIPFTIKPRQTPPYEISSSESRSETETQANSTQHTDRLTHLVFSKRCT